MPYLEFINDYPRNRETGWSDECQGITHDEGNWYISQKTRLWKFPIATHDLNEGVSLIKKIADPQHPRLEETLLNAKLGTADLAKGIRCAAIPRELWDRGYNHFGDIDYYQGYILGPLEHKDFSQPPLIAVFDAATLTYRSSAALNFEAQARKGESPKKAHAPWCAVNLADGYLYSSSDDNVSALAVYTMQLSSNGMLILTFSKMRSLKDAKNRALSPLKGIQGGVFSTKGKLFYLVTNAGVIDGGIYVFETGQFRLLGHQQVDYNPGIGTWEELEGITIWDVEGDRHRNAKGLSKIRGQLHLVMLDNDGLSSDDTYIKHFRAPDEAKNPVQLVSQQELVAEIAAGQEMIVYTGLAKTDFKGFVSKVRVGPTYQFDKAGWYNFSCSFEIGRSFAPGEVLSATANLSLAGISNQEKADFAGWSVSRSLARWNPATGKIEVSANFGIRDSDGYINGVAYRVVACRKKTD